MTSVDPPATAIAIATARARAGSAACPRSLLDFSLDELRSVLAGAGVSPAHIRPLWRRLHHDLEWDLSAPPDFPPPLRRWLERSMAGPAPFFIDRPRQVDETASSDGLTQKFLLQLDDGKTVETVLMQFRGRHTACVSTQVGCAMGCVFCATGQMGFVRNLRPGEIVAQVRHAQRVLIQRGLPGLRNLVLMGMGEPLHNADAVLKAIQIISDPGGLNIGPSRITLSTVGMVPGILRLAHEVSSVNLAISLHGATDEERTALVPIGHRWPLAELMEACRTYCAKTGRHIFFEWTLIAGKNDSTEQAKKLANLLQGIPSHVNLIPLNPTEGYLGTPTSLEAAKEFQRILRTANIPSTLRQRRGIDVAAGCGQLRASHS